VRHPLLFLLTLVASAAAGLGLTALAARHPPDIAAVRIGPWTALPKSGTPDVDPYRLAAMAAGGGLPLAAGDGIAFVARTTSNGQPLNGLCPIVVEGPVLPARAWTLSVMTPDGRPVANPAGRYGLTSTEALARPGGGVRIVVAPQAQAGNWLPSGGRQSFVLVFSIYDTPVAVADRNRIALTLPAIRASGCLP
jgi:hypothetical protein